MLLASTWGKTMYHYEASAAGRYMCAVRLWQDGQPHFKTFDDFKSHTYQMADEAEGEEVTIYDDLGAPVAYMYLLGTKSWHRPGPGIDLTILAIRSDSQSSRKVLETVRHIICEVGRELGITWYARAKHQGSTEIIITKEI